MEAIIEQLPRSGQMEFMIHVSTNIHFSAEAARRLVGRFAANEIAYLLRGGEPTLIVAERVCWRVPVLLTLPGQGIVGPVGQIDVDVETGEIIISSEDIRLIQEYAEQKAAHYSSPSSSLS
ncbi:MAG: hypothetical protein KJ063_03365 [Anaerolineae bacterium]|nr:hypothetical protein [Anaerolineae bacterium]